MDPKFLEFWGHALLDAARGQRQLAQLTEWSRRGVKDLGELSRQFAAIYGLPQPETPRPDTAGTTWQAAEQQFRQAFKQFLDMLDVVPRSEHRALMEKHRALQAQVAAHQKIIEDLKRRLSAKGGAPPDPAEGFTELIRQQAHQFQEIMNRLANAQDGDES